ncbi:serine hydrolase domain-containing protein [Flexithrix dorotheae]|uniref:serine hydrolase domain-containing protein n=1 Tax=Flexithrix dorotheae TaxID=70993 RepID=UPI00036368B5|nr:serine hydrolase [Flexithrix dorotheae]
MKNYSLLLLILFISGFSNPHFQLERAGKIISPTTPESLGISSQAILNFVEAAEKMRPNDLHSFMILRHGQEAAAGWWSPYDAESPHMLYSLSKSFTSTAIGLAQNEGLLSIDDPVIGFFPDETPENPSENLKAMRIRDLLKMNSGHNEDATQRMVGNAESWVKGFLALEVEHKPGTHFVYNTAATFMLSAIIQKVSGKTLEEYLTPRIFEPLDITTHKWDQNMNGINVGGWGLNIRTKDIANFGQLYLQKGKWKGKQLIPENWVVEATSYQTSNGSNPESDWEQGYGYQFWQCRHGLYRGDGAFGQFCIVLPEQDAVIAITSGSKDMQAIMNLVWDHLLPAFKDEPLEENLQAQRALSEKLSNLKLSPVQGENTAKLARKISGKAYMLEENEWDIEEMLFNLKGKENTLILKGKNGEFSLPIGIGEFKESKFNFPQIGQQSVAISGAWTEEDTFKLLMYLDETPYAYTCSISFEGNNMTMERELNVNFGNTKRPAIQGKIAEKGK